LYLTFTVESLAHWKRKDGMRSERESKRPMGENRQPKLPKKQQTKEREREE
jgi:hypothetical protein